MTMASAACLTDIPRLVYIVYNEEIEGNLSTVEYIDKEVSNSRLKCVYFTKDGNGACLEIAERVRLLSAAEWVVILWGDTHSGTFTYELYTALYLATTNSTANILCVLPQRTSDRSSLFECFPKVPMKKEWISNVRMELSRHPKKLNKDFCDKTGVAAWIFKKIIETGGTKLSCPGRISTLDRAPSTCRSHLWERTYIAVLNDVKQSQGHDSVGEDTPALRHEEGGVERRQKRSPFRRTDMPVARTIMKTVKFLYLFIFLFSIVDLSVLVFWEEFIVYLTFALVGVDLVLISLNLTFYAKCCLRVGWVSYSCLLVLVVLCCVAYCVLVFRYNINARGCSFVMFAVVYVGGALAHGCVYFSPAWPRCR